MIHFSFKKACCFSFLSMVLLLLTNVVVAQTTIGASPYIVPASGNYTIPAGVTSITVECIGGGGSGAGTGNAKASSSGGGGGAYVQVSNYTVSPLGVLTIQVGTGGAGTSATPGANGQPSYVSYSSTTFISAAGGTGGSIATAGAGGQIASNIPANTGYNGGTGGTGVVASTFNRGAGGGGGGAGTGGAGNNGGNGTANATTWTGGAGGATKANFGGKGGDGAASDANCPGHKGGNATADVSNYGGGGGGCTQSAASCGTASQGGNGARGLVRITYCSTGPIPTPTVGTTTQPTCLVSTGSVALSGLPSSGTWTLTASPGGATLTSTGTTANFTGLASGSAYTFVVSLGACISSSTAASTTIAAAPVIPSAPAVTSPLGYCKGETPSALTATGSGLLWYTAATGGTGSAIAPTPSTAAVGLTSYWVSQTVTCESARSQIDVNVNSSPSNVSASNSGPICVGEPLSLTASSTEMFSYKWVGPGSTGTSGQIYQQDFSLLPTSGNTTWTDNTTIPGWYQSAATTLTLGTGSATTTTSYNFGVAGTNALTDRALGSKANTTAQRYAVKITNNTGATVDRVFVSYAGERWRIGTTAQTLVFAYQVNAAGIATGTYTAVPALNFATSSLATSTGTAATTDGNNAAHRAVNSATINVTIAAGASIWLRWSHTGSATAGAQQSLAIDDVNVILYNSGNTLLATPSATVVSGTTFSSGYIGSDVYTIPSATVAHSGVFTLTAYPNGDNSCEKTATTNVTVNPRPTAVLSGTASTCSGAPTDLSVALTGTGPWSMTYTDGTTPVTVTATASPFMISVAPTVASTTYTVTALSDDNCTAIAGDLTGSATITTSACAATWLGTGSSDWGTPANWSPAFVPNSCATDITIPAGTPNDPVISSASYTVGNVNIASGVNLTLTGNNLNVCGNWAGGSGANAVTVGSGNVILQGTSAQTITGNTNFESLTVNSTGGYTNSGTVTIARVYRPQSGTLTNTGSLTFLSTSPSDIATIDLTTGNTGTITGNIVAQRFVPVSGSNQHYVSSPVDNLSLSQFGASGGGGFVVPTATCDELVLAAGSPYGSVFRYSEANGAACSLAGWEVVGGGNAENARGYSAYLTGLGSPISVTGTANMTSSYTKTGLTNSNWTNTTAQGRSQNSGWSLVGNPYLSTINLADKTAAGLDNQAQVWHTSGPFVGTYQPVIMGSGTAFVAPFQGFMVHKTTIGGTVDFGVGRAECVNNTSTFYKTGNSNGTLSIKVAGNGYNDITKVVFDDQATNSFDPTVDANKLPVRLVQPSIATKVSNTLYAINTLESISTNPIVAMDFMAGTNGTFAFTVDDISTFDPTVMIYLEDKNTATAWQDLRANNSYTFTGTMVDEKDRFVLHFEPAAFVEAIDGTCATSGKINMEQEGNTVWTVNVKDNANTVVTANQTFDATHPISISNLSSGNYSIQMVHASGYTTTKVIAVGGANAIVASYTASNVSPFTNQAVSFTSTVNQTANITWDFGDGTTSTQANPIHVYATAGNYTVLLTATSTDGCVSAYTQTIEVRSSTTSINTLVNAKEVAAYTVENNKVVVAFKGYTNETAKISMYNVLGQELFTTSAHKADANFVHTIDQVEMQYVMVRVSIGGQTITKKVIVINK